jgi:hypothetical protein
MPNRTIKTTAHDQATQLRDSLASLFALELMAPSEELFLISPWISDVELLNSAFGQFRSVMPEVEGRNMRLSSILNTLAERGTTVRIICREEQGYTRQFLDRLTERIQKGCLETLHEKLLITRHFYFRGSMNFTYSGINLNDEHSELSTDPGDIAKALIEARRRWESISDA